MKRLSFSLLFLFPIVATAQFSVATVFSSNMVLQRDEPIAVWGKAAPGAKVEVSISANKKIIVAAADSSWIVYLPKQPASFQAQSLHISSGDTAVHFNNILVGDVWLCIGQSNMEWPMQREQHYQQEKNMQLAQLRFYNPSYAGKNIFGTAFTDSVFQRLNVENFYNGSWQQCNSESIKTMSAAAYYFGKRIVTEANVPVGLINLSIGGAPLETFIDANALQQNRKFAAKIKGDWLLNETLPVWVKERGRQNLFSKNNVPTDANGKAHAYKPGFAYKAGVEPLLRLAIKGVLNYQGESNAQEIERVEEYAALSALLIDDYRKKWKRNLPYYFVQLSSIDTVHYKGHLWPQFRNEQRKMLSLIANSGMAVCSDVGAANDVHPPNKKTVGERLARWALHQTYGKKEIVPTGPLPVKVIYKNGQVIISFQYAEGLQAKDNDSVKGFSIDGKELSEVLIHNKQVLVKLKQKPAYIYYGWQPLSKGNLQNAEQLPASTFKLKVE